MAMLLTTCYYDDFPCIERAPLADSAELTFKDMLKILGIQASEDSDKDKPFDRTFEPLGVKVDLTDSVNGKIVVAPKPKRIEYIRNIVSGILGNGAMRGSEAASSAQKARFLREAHFGSAGQDHCVNWRCTPPHPGLCPSVITSSRRWFG